MPGNSFAVNFSNTPNAPFTPQIRMRRGEYRPRIEGRPGRDGMGRSGEERRGAERADGLSSASVAGLFGKGVLSEKDRI
jgi:hypothetical protein